MIRCTIFAGKPVAVFGLGASGNATARALREGGAEVAAWDDSEAGRKASAALGIPLVDLAAADWSRFAALVLAPGVPLTHPEPHWTVKKAHAAGIEVIGDVELFFRERVKVCPAAPVICITGTNGKSTTTALTTHILRSAGLDTQMGGNIGVPVLALEPPAMNRFHVLELSSFQIDLTPSLKPTVGVLLNITPDHIDRHGTVEHYAAVKERLVQTAARACVGVDDAASFDILQRRAPVGPTVAFSVERSIRPGYCLVGPEAGAGFTESTLICSDATGLAVRLGSTASVATLRGRHNAQNALAAVAAVRECLNEIGRPLNIDWQRGLDTYPGLAHRMEEIGELAKAGGRVLFINDSKATNADSTDKALASFPRDIFWILGGKPKEGGITTLQAFFPRIANAYLIGQATEEFAATLEGKVAYERCGTLDRALAAATRDALASAGAESIILLSPACASYDQFKSFEHRGDTFRQLVAAIPGVRLKEKA